MNVFRLRCKAFCGWLEHAVWILIAIGIFGLWGFSIYQTVNAYHGVLP